jgi:hypothetical protein
LQKQNENQYRYAMVLQRHDLQIEVEKTNKHMCGKADEKYDCVCLYAPKNIFKKNRL